MSARDRRMLVVAYQRATLIAYLVEAPPEERHRLGELLEGLRSTGAVAWFSFQLPPAWMSAERTVDAISGVAGRFTVDAILRSPLRRAEPGPAWLMPVWPFDHERFGQPASTGDLLGATLEFSATPCTDEEGGVVLPGRAGRWHLTARTIGAV